MNNGQSKNIPLISVVMPVYNGAATLKESVDSVLYQTFENFELIICNDASSDDTANILESITDERVRVINNIYNLGEGRSRDEAIKQARGIWIAVLDADDAWAPERLEKLLKVAGTSTDKMIFDDIFRCHDTPNGMVPWKVLRGKNAFDANGKEAVEVPIENFVSEKRLLIKPIIPLNYIRNNHIVHSSRIFAADTEYFLWLLTTGLKLLYVPRAMYYYRITPGSATSITNRSKFMREVLENAITRFDNKPVVQAALRKRIILSARNEMYISFLSEIKQYQVKNVIKKMFKIPWVIYEFHRRWSKDLIYNAHRIIHKGRARRRKWKEL